MQRNTRYFFTIEGIPQSGKTRPKGEYIFLRLLTRILKCHPERSGSHKSAGWLGEQHLALPGKPCKNDAINFKPFAGRIQTQT